MTVAIVGSLSVGIVVGWLVRFFIRRFKKFGPAALSAVVSVLLGGTVVKFLEADRSVIWYYPIGLLAGFIIYTIVAVLGARRVRIRARVSVAAVPDCRVTCSNDPSPLLR